jgi:hypothetical protein
MPRLIDDLRAPGARLMMPHFVCDNKANAWQALAKRTHALLANRELPVLLIDNVAEYFYTSDQEYWDLRDDFPNLAPPYPAFWCESRMVRKIHSKECGDSDLSAIIPHGGRLGMLIHGLDREEANGEGIPENARWILWCELFIDYGLRGVTATGPHGSVFMCVDADGALIDRPWMQSFASDADAEIMKGYMTFFNPCFLAMSFLHCKNVTLVENHVPAPLAKKYRARHGIAPCSYKTLVIEPLKKILRTEGRSDHVGVQKALHICRGHFRDYREGRGLFGRYHQLVWQPSIVRGSKGEMVPPREIEVKM